MMMIIIIIIAANRTIGNITRSEWDLNQKKGRETVAREDANYRVAINLLFNLIGRKGDANSFTNHWAKYSETNLIQNSFEIKFKIALYCFVTLPIYESFWQHMTD